MIHPPSSRQLRYFTTLARTLSFHRAAEECHVTQPTLSSGIRELEQLLGVVLFERTGKKVFLTAAGHQLLPQAARVLDQGEALLLAAKRLREPRGGVLRLGIIPTVAPAMLPGLLDLTARSLPDLEIEIHEDLSHHLVERLHRRELDLAVLAFPYPAEGLEVLPLYDEALSLAVRTVDAPKGPITARALKDHRLILMEDGHCLREHALMACPVGSAEVRSGYRAASLETLLILVAAGKGATLFPSLAARHLPLDRYGVTLLPITEPEPHRTIGLAWRPDSAADATIRAFASVVEQDYATGRL